MTSKVVTYWLVLGLEKIANTALLYLTVSTWMGGDEGLGYGTELPVNVRKTEMEKTVVEWWWWWWWNGGGGGMVVVVVEW